MNLSVRCLNWMKCLCFCFFVAQCFETISPENGEVVYSKPYMIIGRYKRFSAGTRASYRCKKGFNLMNHRTTRTCTFPPYWTWFSHGVAYCVQIRGNRN